MDDVSETSAKSANDRWPQEVRELAYQLWSFGAGRNAAKVAALLAERGYPVPERSVQYWAKAGDWAQRAHDDLARLAPDIRRQTIAELIYGSLEAAQGLRSVVRGEFIEADRAYLDDLAAQMSAGEMEEREYRRLVDTRLNLIDRTLKTRVSAYLGMLDRGGFSPVGSNAPELPKVSVAQAAEDFRSMSPEERLEAERRLRLGAGDLAATSRQAAGKRRS